MYKNRHSRRTAVPVICFGCGFLSSAFADEFFLAPGAGDGDLALALGNPDILAAPGAIIIAMVPVLDPVEDLQELPVLLITLVGIAGEGPADGPDHQAIGKCRQQQISHRHLHKARDHADHQRRHQNRQIQFIRSISSCHEPLHRRGYSGQKLSNHNQYHLARESSYIILQKRRISTQ